MTNHSVLIANHDAVVANRCGILLKSLGYVVTVAFTSDEAIRLAAEANPALLILDPVMPGLSGFEAAAHIARRVGCRVLFLTNLAGDADFAELLSGMVRDGIHCTALPPNVSNADLITFVHSELGPVIPVTDAEKGEPRKEGGAAPEPPPRGEAEDIDLPAGSIPIENDDDLGFKTREEPYSPLFAIANSNLYQTNAFRVTGLHVAATTRDVRRVYQEFNRNKELGRAWLPACFIPHVVDPSDDERETAFTQIDNPEQRLLQEFFWFWPDTEADDAFAAVRAKELNPAVREWRRRVKAGDPEGVASHNLAVFNHLMALQIEGWKPFGQDAIAPDFWSNAFLYWRVVVENSRFWQRFIRHIKQVNDPRITPALAEKIWASLPEAILHINAANAVRAAEGGRFAEAGRQRQLMYGSGLGKENADKALSRALTPMLQHLTLLCSQAKSQVVTDPGHGLDVVRALNDAKSPILKTLNCLVGADDPRRVAAHDEAATAMRSCLIDYVNETENWSAALPLFENCLALAEEAKLQSRLSEDIATLRGNLESQRTAQTPSASAKAKPPSRPASASSGTRQRSTSAAHKTGLAVGRIWQATPLFVIWMIVLAVSVLVVGLSSISGTGNSETKSTAPPASGGPLDAAPSSSTSYDPSSAYPSAVPHSADSSVPANDVSESKALKTDIEQSKERLRGMEEEMQALNAEMSEYTTSIDSDRSALDQIKGEGDAGSDVDQEQYEQIRSRHNQNVASYNRDAERHNYLLREYNALLSDTNRRIDKYNSIVKSQ